MQRWIPLLVVPLILAFTAGSAVAETEFTGDIIDGKPVIAKLDVASLEGGKVHKFFFSPVDNSVGQGWYVPVMVAKGPRSGPGLLLNASIHGDELNGVAVIQRLFEELDPQALRGAVIALPGLNPSGMMLHTRFFFDSSDGGSPINLNRVAPGKPDNGSAGERFIGRLWTQIYEGNVSAAIDMHSQSRGTDYPLYVFADYRNPKIKRLAEMLQPDMIKVDTGLAGTVEDAFNKAGIPAVTFEIGAPKRFEWDHIDHAMRGIRNVMIDMDMMDGEIEDLGIETFVGNYFETVSANAGGFTEILVELKQAVTKGQRVAVQRNAFGEIVAEYHAPFDARVLSVATDPLREPGATVVRFLHWNESEKCRHGCRPGY